jgi:GNAT superfamily N-acetyltransferase
MMPQRESDSFALISFETRYAEIVLTWVVDQDEAAAWAGLNELPVDTSVFARWHADPEVHGSILMHDGVPVAYGEIWENFDCDAVELSRLIVAPSRRGQGVARILIERLCTETVALAAKTAYLRARPGNTRATCCYERAGFCRVSPEQERDYNTGQPVAYVWMSRTIAPAR